jgi:iron-sulfur cluster assembly protein CyaY
MNDAEFERHAADTLLHIEQAVESCGAEIEFENSGGILTLEFANGTQIIVNKQGATKQIWVAAKSGGFHYGRDGQSGKWIRDHGGTELFADLSRLASEQAGTAVRLES